MSSANSITYASVQSFAFGAAGFASGYLAQPLLKAAITRLALGAIGASILGGSNRAENLYLQAMGVGVYSIISAIFIALDVLNIPLALTPLLYPLFLVFLTYKNQGSSKWEQNLRPINFLPETPLDFVIGREILASLKTLFSKTNKG
jgi:hypothetical protein